MTGQQPAEKAAGALQPGGSQTGKVKFTKVSPMVSGCFLADCIHSKAEAPMQVVHEGQEGKPVQTKDGNLVSKVANAVGLGSTSDKVSQLLGQVYTD